MPPMRIPSAPLCASNGSVDAEGLPLSRAQAIAGESVADDCPAPRTRSLVSWPAVSTKTPRLRRV